MKVDDNITPKYLKLDTEFISVSKIDNEKEEIPTSFLLLPIIMDFVLAGFKVSLFHSSFSASSNRSGSIAK